MKEDILNNYLTKLFNAAEKELSSFKRDKDPERLHHLRVDIKKIRALLSFAEKMYEEKYAGNELKPLFHAAGNIRTMQVNIKLLKTLPGVPQELIGQLKKKELAITGVFIKNIYVHKNKIEELRNRINLPAKVPHKKALKKYFKNQFHKADKKFRKEEREEMHLFRMKIKKLMYVYNALPKKLQEYVSLDKKGINKFQEKTGNWHDTYSAVKFLSHQRLSKKMDRFILKLKEKEKKQFRSLILNKPDLTKKVEK
ncbi:MAG: CHAD domain-containing protein [Bacteroidia bacterium]